jgi:hypothetical protein
MTFGTALVVKWWKSNTETPEVMKTRANYPNTYAASRTVEITVWLIGLLVLSLLLASTSSSANEFYFEEETYIPDIPFNTERVVHDLLSGEFDFEEEAYVNDIPFNTAEICANCLYRESVSVAFEREEENYIDDIPFDTKGIVMEYEYDRAMEQTIDFPGEDYVNDIPFDTRLVAEKTGKQCTGWAYASYQ